MGNELFDCQGLTPPCAELAVLGGENIPLAGVGCRIDGMVPEWLVYGEGFNGAKNPV